jgi:methyl-accepting chemotaxis protein
MDNAMRRFSLRWKILLALAGLSIVPLTITLVLISGMTENLISRDMLRLAEKTGNFVQGSAENSRRESANYIDLLSSGADMVNAVFYAGLTGEPDQLQEPLQNARERYRFDVLEILDPGGQTLLSSRPSGFASESAADAHHPVIKSTLAGQPADAFTSVQGRLAIMVATPVLLEGRTAGHLLGITFLDDLFAQRIRQLSGAEIAFFDGKRLVASSHPEMRDQWQPDSTGADRHQEITLADTPHLLIQQNLDNAGRGILLAIDRTEQLASSHSMKKLLLLTLLGSAALALVVSYAFSQKLISPLSVVVGSLREIAEGEGDLTRTLEVTARDEVGDLADSFNSFIQRLREMVQRIRTVSAGVNGATGKIRQSSSEIHKGAGRQKLALENSFQEIQGIESAAAAVAGSAGSLLHAAEESSSATQEMGAATMEIDMQMEKLLATVEELSGSLQEMATSSQQIAENIDTLSSATEVTASSVIEMDAAIKEIEGNAERTNRLAEAAASSAEKGKEAVHASIEGITILHQTVDSASLAMKELNQQSGDIGKILTVIDEVADKTSLLALNAAIIAAQAGEHGRGFAVVAEEIRELADRTAASTREIGTIIGSLQGVTHRAAEAMERGNAVVAREVERSTATGATLDAIHASTLQASAEVRGIVSSTQEQARGSKQITSAVNRVVTMLEQTTKAVKQQSDGIRQLARGAESLQEVAVRVKQGTGEQTRGSQQIATNPQRMRQMVEQINSALREQTQRNRQVVEAVNESRSIADDNALRIAELDQVVDTLTQEADALHKETGAFRA